MTVFHSSFKFFPFHLSSFWQLLFSTCVRTAAERRRFIWTGIAHFPAYFRVSWATWKKIAWILSGFSVLLLSLSRSSSSSSRRLAGACLVPALPTPAARRPPAEAFSAAWEANRAKTRPTRTRLVPRRPQEGSDSRLRQVGLHRLQE